MRAHALRPVVTVSIIGTALRHVKSTTALRWRWTQRESNPHLPR
jgi:hypothetical protein